MKGAYDKYRRKGLEVIGLGFQDTESNIISYVRDKSMPWPAAYDKGDSIGGAYGIRFGAGMVFIDGHGVIRERFLGGVNEKQFEDALGRIVNPQK